jgi:hypothetical protein
MDIRRQAESGLGFLLEISSKRPSMSDEFLRCFVDENVQPKLHSDGCASSGDHQRDCDGIFASDFVLRQFYPFQPWV